MTENEDSKLIEAMDRMEISVNGLRDDFAKNNSRLIQAVIGQDRVPVSTLNKVVDANARERKFWAGAVMALIAALITALVVGPKPAHSEPLTIAKTIQGYDDLGMAMHCNAYLAAPRLSAVSTLHGTFGDVRPCLKKRIAQGGLELLQVDLIDATCWRSGKCPPGAARPDDLAEITKRARLYAPFADIPGLSVWLSPALEHDVKNETTVRAMLAAAQKGCPKCRVINSPFSGARPAGVPLELHGTKVTAFSVSGDGSSLFDGDTLGSDGNGFEHQRSGKFTTFAWWNELNGRCTGEKDFTPPLKRTEKPTADQYRQAWQNMQPEQPKPAAPPQCKSVRDIQPGKEIAKPNAESYCNGQPKDPRSNKPLLILQRKGRPGERLDVLSPKGKKVACFKYYGAYSGIAGAQRYYVGDCSGEAPMQLFDKLGGEWGFLALGGGQCLRFNAVRRQGTYR